MRSFFLITATALALFAAFFIYTKIAAPVRVSVQDASPLPTTLPSSDAQPYAAGAWVNLYDKDGQLYGRLRAKVATPEPDKRALLTEPEAEFYQHDGRIVRLVARDGDVRLGGDSDRSPLSGGPVSLPSQGTLQDVTITMYPGPTARDLDDPDLTLHMDNTQFDADTYRLFTVAQPNPAGGPALPADRIPVHVRGRDLDFDGWGLMVIWDGQIHELKSLLVAHGQRMRLKSASAYQSPDAPPPKESTHAAPTATTQKTRPEALRVYQATFSENVRVVPPQKDHGPSGEIHANQMIVTFAARGEGATSPTVPAHAASAKAPPSPADSPVPLAQSADVYWSGTLRIIPAPATTPIALLPGQATVRFTGLKDQPMRLTLTRDGKSTGLVLAEQADYSQNGPLLLSGDGVGVFADPDKPADVMHVGWSKSCNLTFAGGGGSGGGGKGDQFQLQRADLLGDAQLHDGSSSGEDKLRLDADRIIADFAPGAANSHSAQIKQLVAAGHANCLIHDNKEPDRTFSTDLLTLDTALDSSGNLYPRTITADGHFHGVQDKDQITSQHMVALLAPQPKSAAKSAAPAIALESFTATGNVLATGKDGSTAAGDLLRVEQSNGRQITTLLGAPMAVVSGGNGTVRGREIDIDPQAHLAWIVGHGLLDSVRAAEPGKPPSPVHVEWEKSAKIDGGQNRIDVDGGVYADTTDATGAKSSARGDHVVVDLIPAPQTSGPSAKHPQGVDSLDLLRDKQVKLITLQRHAWIDSTQPSTDGSIARRTHIEGPDIRADLPNQLLVVEGAGRMLLEDHSKSHAKPDAREDTKQGDNGHGLWGIQWQTRFTFDQLAGKATIEGPDRIIQWSDSSPNGATEIVADDVLALFNPKSPDTKNGEMSLKQLEAHNHVQITTFADRAMTKPEKTVEAQTVIYEPTTEMLTITGGPDGRVRVTQAHSAQIEQGDRVQINLRTHDFKISDFSAGDR